MLRDCVHCNAVSAPPSLHVVATHYLEPFGWAKRVLQRHVRVHLFLYECGVAAPLPAAVVSHPRVTVRDKSGSLAQRDPFYSFFDHVVRTYSELSDYTMFMHGHDTHYHRQTPTALAVEQALRLVESKQVDYVNLGSAVHSTWAGCASFAAIQSVAPPETGPPPACLVAPPCVSMTALVNGSWEFLADVLGSRAPASVAEINGNEALVSRCRLLARPLAFWSKLRDLTRSHHGQLAYGLEGSFHRIMGEPWVRPFIVDQAQHLNFVACGVDAHDTLWPGRWHEYGSREPPFDVRWQNHTELSLRIALPSGGGDGGECDP